jgi:hypothetical protein
MCQRKISWRGYQATGERDYSSPSDRNLYAPSVIVSTILTHPQDTQTLLIDLGPLSVAPKILPPLEKQLPNESLRFWSGVTNAIKSRQFSRATSLKQELEERQREKARQREESGTKWEPRFFTGAVTPLGRPELTEDGKEALQGLQEGRWELKESLVTGA